MKSEIADALLTHIKGAGLSIPIAFPGAEFPQPTGAYVQVSLFPSPTAAATLTSHDVQSGVMQASVFWPRGEGLISPMAVADAICARFARNTEIKGTAVVIHINRPPYTASILQEAGWMQLPVTIPWTAWVRN